MVDENPPRAEETQPPAAEPGQPARARAEELAASTEERATEPEAEAASRPAAPAIEEALQVEFERERWLRRRFEREHEVLLALTRLVIAGLSSESRAMRFWRWLIDDTRSERRLTAGLGPRDEETVLVRRVLAWFRERRFDTRSRIPPQYGEPNGSSGGGPSPLP